MTVEQHPVAALLNDEMRERLRAATFVPNDDPDNDWCATVIATVDGRECCPLGVALGEPNYEFPSADDVMEALDLHDSRANEIINAFIDLVDHRGIAPEDVKTLLGVEPAP